MERFFDGQTSNAEEQELYSFFNSSDVPEALKSYQPVFGYFETGIREELNEKEAKDGDPSRKSTLKKWLWIGTCAAASMFLFFCLHSCYILKNNSLTRLLARERFIRTASGVLPVREAISSTSHPSTCFMRIQEVFLKLWCIHDKLEAYDSVEALAMQTTRHLCLNRLKSFQFSRKEQLSEEVIVCEHATPYTELEQKDSIDQVMRIIDRLPGLRNVT